MIFRPLIRLAARATLVALATASVAVGCSRQGEGERCDFEAAGHDDCDSGLVCIQCERLVDLATDRCCPVSGSTDPRCAQRTGGDGVCISKVGTGGTGGTTDGGAGSAGAAGSAGSAGASAGGAAGSAGSASGGTAGEDEPAGAGGA